VILGGVAALAVTGAALAWKVLSQPRRDGVRRNLFGVLDQPACAGLLAAATAIVLVADGYALVRSPRTAPVVLLVPNNRFINGLSDPIRLELTLQEPDGRTQGSWSIAGYEGKPLWIGTRKELEVPAETRQNYLGFSQFHEAERFPTPPLALKPGMRLQIKLYYANSNKLYLDPPQEPIVVQARPRDSDAIQVQELDGPL
jgi:hypothetical protein